MLYERIERALTESLVTLAETAAALLPKLLGAIFLLAAGWLLARLLRASLRRLIDTLVGSVGDRLQSSAGLAQATTQRTVAAALSGGLYWLVLMIFALAAVRVLDFPVLNEVFVGITGFIPNMLGAGLILLLGYMAGEFARGGITRAAGAADIAHGDFMGRAAQVGILVLALVVAVDELGIDSKFLVVATAIVLASTFGGAAVAFGLGAQRAVGNLLASHYVQRLYRRGQTVRIGDTEGRILDITETAVVMETLQGRVSVPASRFSEESSVLVTEEH
jgi:small-conductance mechanosensitive channel